MGVRTALAALAAMAAFSGALAYADGPDSALSAAEINAAKGVTQSIPLADGALRLDLTRGYVFIPPPKVPPILKKLDAPAPSATVLGAVAPGGRAAGDARYWVAVLTYDPVGHVPETGADELGAITFIDTVKAARPPTPGLQSFAVAPNYDPIGKALIWCEQYAAKSSRENAIRHEQRLLGRAGDAGVTTIGRPGNLEAVKGGAKAVLAMLAFNDGYRYVDFVEASDRVSDYDLPGLISGKRRAPPPPVPAEAPKVGAFTLSDLLPGRPYGWASYLAGGVVLLGLIWFAIRAITNRGSSTDVT
jgi:uncharacterized membrane-anchored protein